MKTLDKIKERVQIGLRISELDYFVGLTYLLNCLFEDYFKYVEEEGRLKGIMLRYRDKINQSFLDYFGEQMTEERYDFSGRLVFLYKNLVYREFHYMNKKLSPADRVIVIIKRIFDFMYSKREAESFDVAINHISEITNNLFDNVRWKQKNTDLHRFIKTLDIYFREGFIGKQPLWKFSINEEQKRYSKKYQNFSETKVLMDENNEQLSIGL